MLLRYGLAAALVLPSIQIAFQHRVTPDARAVLRRNILDAQLHAMRQGDGALSAGARERMRSANPEWDFMNRTFLALALSELARNGSGEERAEQIAAVDSLIEDTLRLERDHGAEHFLLPYVHRRPFVDVSGRSVFVDGEIALMMAVRERAAKGAIDSRWTGELRERLELIRSQMERSPTLSAESYPDECWMFCNSVAAAAMSIGEEVGAGEHASFARRFVDNAKQNLRDPETGLLISEYTLDGTPQDGPEGSSIYFVATMLAEIDPEFAADQYQRARRELGAELLGFGYAREWPESWRGVQDIDSGLIVPGLDASAGASGMAILGAARFGDEETLQDLHRSLHLAAFPIEEEGQFRFAASNSVGDAVLLYALALEHPTQE